MSYFIDICLICLKQSKNLIPIGFQDTNTTSIENKLKYFLPELELNLNISEYICTKCENKLRRSYDFKQKCLQNITTYKKYAQQITTTDSSYKYLSVSICSDFVYEGAEISEEIEPQIDKNDNTVIIKEEPSEELVLDDKLESLLHEIKNENDNVQTINQEEVQYECLKYIKCIELYECQNCDGKFSNFEDLEKHELAHKLECKICNKSFKNPRILETHQLTHTNKRAFTCKICRKSFKLLHHLKTHHYSVHSAERPHTCEICNKSFKLLQTLKQHKLVHTGEKPFTCEVCKKSFRHSSNLKYHQFTHSGENVVRPKKSLHECEICNKSFKKLRYLKEHRSIHSGEKPHQCEVCNKSFRQARILKAHKLVHTGNKLFICTVCNESFTQQGALRRHRDVHAERKAFICEVCNKPFKELRYLKRHLLMHSGESREANASQNVSLT